MDNYKPISTTSSPTKQQSQSPLYPSNLQSSLYPNLSPSEHNNNSSDLFDKPGNNKHSGFYGEETESDYEHGYIRFSSWLSLPRLATLFAVFCLVLILIIIFIFVHRSNDKISYMSDKSFASNPSSSLSKVNVFKKGAVSTEVPLCSTTGKEILKLGGNAVDAAIASLLCLGVINNFSTGIGGGGFFLIKKKNEEPVTINFREKAPFDSSSSVYERFPNSTFTTGLSVAVPGEIKGLQYAHKKFGKLPWKDLFMPAISVARDGFTVSPTIAHKIRTYKDLILRDEGLTNTYTKDGELLKESDIITRKNLAKTLEIISKDPDSFYTGALAKRITSFLSSKGSTITLEDLKSYSVSEGKSISSTYRNKTIISVPAPASGAIGLEALGILENFDLAKDGLTAANVHLVVEALKFAYGSRLMMGDPTKFSDNKIQSFERHLTDKTYLKVLASKISPDKVLPSEAYYEEDYRKIIASPHLDRGTVHVCVVDEDGTAVSVTSSVNYPFGSGILDDETGILFNNVMDDFSLPNTSNDFGFNNSIAGSKTPFSSNLPIIVLNENNDIEYVIGGVGGIQIISSVVSTLVNILDYKMSLGNAILYPRIHPQLSPKPVKIEAILSKDLIEFLRSRGNQIQLIDTRTTFMSCVQAIKINADRSLEAVADHRKGGSPDGY